MVQNSSSDRDDKANVIQKFIGGTVTLKQAQNKLGKSRATIYRYAKLVAQGKAIEDRRRYGTNRKYGK